MTPTPWITVPEDNNMTPVNDAIWASSYGSKEKKTFKSWMINKLQDKKKDMPVKCISIVDFFISVVKSYEELTPIAEIAKYYEDALIQATVMGKLLLFRI